MSADNFDALMNELCFRKPFQIFTIELSSGKQLEIDHPKGLSFRDGFAIFIAPGGIPNWFDYRSVNRIIESAAEKKESV